MKIDDCVSTVTVHTHEPDVTIEITSVQSGQRQAVPEPSERGDPGVRVGLGFKILMQISIYYFNYEHIKQ